LVGERRAGLFADRLAGAGALASVCACRSQFFAPGISGGANDRKVAIGIVS
jgi:hypothetical protein